MNTPEIRKRILERIETLGAVETLKRLEGTPPQAPLQRLDRGHAERAHEQDAHKNTASAPPIGGQGKGELQRVMEEIREKAALSSEAAKHVGELLGYPTRTALIEKGRAAGLYHAANLLAAAIGEPRPQSGVDGDELETAVEWFRGIAHQEVVRLEELAEKNWSEGADKLGAMYDRLTTKTKRFREVLETLLSQESREERSVPPIRELSQPPVE